MFSWVWVTRWCWGTNEGRWKEKFARLFSPSRILQISPNQANSTILGRACDFSELLQVFCRPGPRHIIWHHHNVHAAKALCNLLVSSMSTAKKVACTNNHHCKRQFCAIAISAIHVVFSRTKNPKTLHRKFFKKLQQNEAFLDATIYKKKNLSKIPYRLFIASAANQGSGNHEHSTYLDCLNVSPSNISKY